MGNFHVKTQRSTDFAHTFSKNYSFLFLYFLIKIIVFYTKNLFIRPKNCVQIIFYNEKYKKFRKNQFFSNIFTFLSVILQNFEANLRILANFGKFSRKNSRIYGFRPYILKKLQGFLFFLINIILFTLKIYWFGPKIAFKAFCTTKDAKSFVKINFLVTFFTFLSVIRQNFVGKFSRKNSKIYGFRPYIFKKLQGFLFFLINIILFTLTIYSFGPKMAFKAFCTTKDAKSFVKINILVTFLHF